MPTAKLDEFKRRIEATAQNRRGAATSRSSQAERLLAAYVEQKRRSVAMLAEVYEGLEYIGGKLVDRKPVSGDVDYEARIYSFSGVTVSLDFAPGLPHIQVKGESVVIGVFQPPDATAVLEAITSYVTGL